MSHVPIEKSTFLKADKDTRDWLIIDLLYDLHSKMDAQIKTCNGRFTSIENNKKKNTLIASGSGLLGGFLAVMAKFAIWGK